jgi:hypothetical protein
MTAGASFGVEQNHSLFTSCRWNHRHLNYISLQNSKCRQKADTTREYAPTLFGPRPGDPEQTLNKAHLTTVSACGNQGISALRMMFIA